MVKWLINKKMELLELTTLYAERAFWFSGVGAPYRVASAARHSAGFCRGKEKQTALSA
jgi:hypothetical protein